MGIVGGIENNEETHSGGQQYVVDVKDIFENVADDNQLDNCPGNTIKNVFSQAKFFAVTNIDGNQYEGKG